MTLAPLEPPIAAVLIHVSDVDAALKWYERAFPQLELVRLPNFDRNAARLAASQMAELQAKSIAHSPHRSPEQIGLNRPVSVSFPMPPTQHSPAADRNKQVILEALLKLLPARGSALEIASGTGQHVSWFASAMPHWTWQPTDFDASSFDSIEAYVEQAALRNVLPSLQLDVTSAQWPVGALTFDAIYCANMLHISPWATCAGLMAGAARHLAPQGVLVTYGPYLEDDVPTAPGNLQFDESLRARNPAWGIRRLEHVKKEAQRVGLALRERLAMPANNLLLVFARG